MFSNNILILIFATSDLLLIISFALEAKLNRFCGLSKFIDVILVFIHTTVCVHVLKGLDGYVDSLQYLHLVDKSTLPAIRLPRPSNK